MQSISTIILTYNEERHIERCISNAFRFSSQVYLVDSYSSDKTVEIAERLGAKVYQNKWENNYAKQLNWGLENLPIETEWVFRLDADEYLTDALIDEIHNRLPLIDNEISGIVFERKMYFLDTLMTKGMLQMNMLRLFKYQHGFCEERWMDEHIVLTQGKSVQFRGFFVDHNLNPLGWWIQKHNGYSIREAIDLLNLEYNFLSPKSAEAQQYEMSADALSKREKKKKYANFFQGWWYRTLVDAKVYEVKKACGDDKEKIKKYIHQNYHIKL